MNKMPVATQVLRLIVGTTLTAGLISPRVAEAEDDRSQFERDADTYSDNIRKSNRTVAEIGNEMDYGDPRQRQKWDVPHLSDAERAQLRAEREAQEQARRQSRQKVESLAEECRSRRDEALNAAAVWSRNALRRDSVPALQKEYRRYDQLYKDMLKWENYLREQLHERPDQYRPPKSVRPSTPPPPPPPRQRTVDPNTQAMMGRLAPQLISAMLSAGANYGSYSSYPKYRSGASRGGAKRSGASRSGSSYR